MEPQNTRNTLMAAVGGALLGQDEALDLKPELADVERQTEMQAGGLQTIQADQQ
jgi:hypothetical protein